MLLVTTWETDYMLNYKTQLATVSYNSEHDLLVLRMRVP